MRQEQVGHVGAAHEEPEVDDAEEQPRRQAEVATDHGIVQLACRAVADCCPANALPVPSNRSQRVVAEPRLMATRTGVGGAPENGIRASASQAPFPNFVEDPRMRQPIRWTSLICSFVLFPLAYTVHAQSIEVIASGEISREPRRPLGSHVPDSATQTKSATEDISSRLEQLILQLMKDGDVPGLSVALIRDGTLVWHRGFGVKDIKTSEPVTDDTVFEAASLGKPVFAYAVMKLVDAGTLDLDVPLNQYLPGNYDVEADPRLDQVTARRVLSHTSGLPNWRSGALRIYFTPGERFSYSGEGYVYLSKVVEHITGEKINDFMTRTVFEALGMKSSSYAWRDSYNGLKTSYHNTRGESTTRNSMSPDTVNVAATLHTTALDYGRFVVALLNGAGLTRTTRDLMLTPLVAVREGGATTVERPEAKPLPDVKWGLGWGVQTTADGPSFFHWGNNGDAKAYVVARDKDKSGVVIFANSIYGLSIVPEIVEEAVSSSSRASGTCLACSSPPE
jgi:CubicO group peptidase (beta-lactamase class C family)